MNTTAQKTHRQSRVGSASRAPVRESYHHGDLPAALKRAAVSLIARNGLEEFSLREAALAVGVSPSAAYRHFEDKSALLRVIAQDAFAEMGQRFQAAKDSVRGKGARAARARFIAQGHAYVGFALEQPERFAVMFGPYGAGRSLGTQPGDPSEAATVDLCDNQPGAVSPYAALSCTLDELTKAGLIDPARREGAELLVWSAIHGLSTLLVSGALKSSATSVEMMVNRIGEDCLRALMHPMARGR